MSEIDLEAGATPAATASLAVRPTRETYEAFQRAYDTLNKALFGNALPNALITLQRRKRSYGYFAANRFGREDGRTADEIALNPAHFKNRPVREILATLAHEMVHLWQHHHGKPGRNRYHNRQWANEMKSIGLRPTDTGREGGKEVGEHMHHIVIDGGAFAKATDRLLAMGFAIPWSEVQVGEEDESPEGAAAPQARRAASKSGKRVKYVCPKCQLAAWAKHDAKLMCGEHHEPMSFA